jgi:peroxin-2
LTGLQGNSRTAKLARLLDTVGNVHSALTLISFTAFLVTGHYRTLLDRVLRMRLVTPNRTVAREVSFEYLNRQLVWHAFTEFLLFILPLLRVGRWRRWWARLLRRVRSSESGEAGETTGELAFLPERTCAICYKETDAESAGAALGGGRATDVTNPYEAVECGHVYCYVCIAGKIELEEGEGWTCLRCGGVVKRCRPWRGGLEGLTGVGDWGEEVYGEHGKAEDDGTSVGSSGGMLRSDLLDELQDDADVDDDESELDVVDQDYGDDDDSEYGEENRRGRVGGPASDAGSEDTVQPQPAPNGLLTVPGNNRHLTVPGSSQWPIDYTDDSVFDDSQYNTAEDYD